MFFLKRKTQHTVFCLCSEYYRRLKYSIYLMKVVLCNGCKGDTETSSPVLVSTPKTNNHINMGKFAQLIFASAFWVGMRITCAHRFKYLENYLMCKS